MHTGNLAFGRRRRAHERDRRVEMAALALLLDLSGGPQTVGAVTGGTSRRIHLRAAQRNFCVLAREVAPQLGAMAGPTRARGIFARNDTIGRDRTARIAVTRAFAVTTLAGEVSFEFDSGLGVARRARPAGCLSHERQSQGQSEPQFHPA